MRKLSSLMNIQELIIEIKNHLKQTFFEIDTWFVKDTKLREYKPLSGWSINQILEHIGLTNYFLLILIEKMPSIFYKIKDIQNT